MQRTQLLLTAFVLAVMQASVGDGAEPAEPLLRKLSPGLVVTSSTELPSTQTKAIGQKLGGDLKRLTNSTVNVHGRTIQVNAMTAVNESQAQAVHAALLKIKPYPFCLRKGAVVIEYVGKDIDAAVAIKTSYELGLLEKPSSVRYRVVAELATVETADYMACNPLFNQFLALRDGTNTAAIQQIKDLTKNFTFGRSLVLRSPQSGKETDTHQFQPDPTKTEETGSSVAYSFDLLPNRHGVPYVTATMDITVNGTGILDSTAAPSPALTAATPFWPADDPKMVALARQITKGKTTHHAKAMAILEWLSPGKNVKYSGQTGSRWGTAKFFEQKFGHCWDFSDGFVTLARAAGVPSRQVAGWLYGSSGHVWAEYYREGQGWQQVDPTGGGKLPCGIYHIAYFTSEAGEMPIVYVSMPKIEPVTTK